MKNFFSGLILTVLFTFTCLTQLNAQEKALIYADSLFQQQKYTEAFKDYESIYLTGNASPAMLMKMAFIKEGLGDYAQALYYLNAYYQLTSDKDALSKMRDIANEHHLTGYEYSDFKFFLNAIQKYENMILFCLVASSLFLLVYIFKQKRKNEPPVTATILQLVVVCLVAVLINGLIYQKSAIIATDKSLLMTGPSAAAEPVDFIGKGHRVEVLDANDIWSKIKWEDQEVYIRNKNLEIL